MRATETRKGRVAACLAEAWLLTLPLALMLEPFGRATAQSVTPVSEVLVVDATGKTVGKALDVATVALEIDGHLVMLRVNRQRILGSGADSLLRFESADCSGQAYASAYALSLGPSLAAVVVTNPGGTVYLGDPGAQWQTVSFRSVYISDPDGTGRCEADVTRVDDAVPVEPLVDLYDLFTPPFHLAAAPTATATATATDLATRTPTLSPAQSATPSVPEASTSTPTAPPPVSTFTPTPDGARACCGDCNGNGVVTVDEVVTGVNGLLFGCPSPPPPR